MNPIICLIAFILLLVSCTDVTPNVSALSRSISKAKIENNYLVFETNFLPKNKDLSISDSNNNTYDLRLVKSEGMKRYYEATKPGLVIKLKALYNLTVKDSQAQSVIPIQFEGAGGGVPTYLKLQTSQTSLSYQGFLTNADGTALTYNNVSLVFQVTDPAGTCVIYREQVDGIDMTASNGFVDVPLGQGINQYPGTGLISDFFNNSGSYSCDGGGGTYSPVVDDSRKLRVTYYDGVSWQTASPDRTFRLAPYVAYAFSAQKLGTNTVGDFLLKAGLPTCGAGTFLTWNGSALTCGTAGVGGGTVTAVTSSNSYLSVATGTSTPALTVNVGTIAGTVAAGDDSRITGAFQSSTSLGGDLAGTLPNPTVSKINGVGVSSAVAGDDGKFLKFINGSGWQPQFVKLSELRNATGTGSAFNVGACTAAQTLVWSSLTDQFSCQNISLPSSNVTGLATVATSGAYSDLTGTPTLNSLLPTQTGQNGKFLTTDGTNTSWTASSSQWTTVSSDVYYNTGKVGIGTSSPSAFLDVVQTSTSTAGNIYGGNISLTTTPGGASSASLFGISSNVTQAGSFGASSLIGVQGNIIQSSTAITSAAIGMQGSVSNSSGTISSAYGGKFSVLNSGGAITSGTGVYIGSVMATTKYSLYASDSTAPSYFAGSVGIGNFPVSTSRLMIKGTTNSSAASGLNVTDLSGNSKLLVRNDGNVGIGTSSPGDSLTIFKNGSTNLTVATTSGTTNQAMLNFATNSTAGEVFGTGVSGKGWQIYANSSSYSNGSGGAEDLGFAFFDGINPWVETMHFNNNGNVGIGTLLPAYKLDVAGDINTSSCFRIGATTVSGTCTSDARLKENIQDYNQGLNEILGIRLRTYQFNGLGEMPKTGETAVGVIAQEVEHTNPDLVKSRMVRMHPEDKELTEIKVVDYSKFSYMLINAVKELYGKLLKLIDQQASQDREIASVKSENAQLKKENAEIKARLERIEKLLQSK